MKQLLLALTLLASTEAFALTDYKCVDDCQAAGNMWGLCQKRCSTDGGGAGVFGSSFKSTDYGCVSRCTSNGYQYSLCQDRCSY